MSTRELVRVALFAAVTATLGLIPPLAVPLVPALVTAQSLGPMLAGAVIGRRAGALSQLAFVVLVAVGLPLLAGGRGGLGVLLGPSGGFVLAFPVGAYVVGLLAGAEEGPVALWRAALAAVVGGVGAVHLIGIPWLAVAGDLGLREAAVGSVAFLPGDLLKVVIAAPCAVAVRSVGLVHQPS